MLAVPYDCPPTLTDEQVLDFCANGYLILPSVVPDEINRRTVEWLADHDESEPTTILRERWFVDAVIKNPRGAGAVRSLLGADFKLPVIMSQHRGACPLPAGAWHRDGGSIITHRLDYLQVFYCPQDTPRESGPTEVVPGSQFIRGKANCMGHYGRIAGSVSTACPAGSIILTDYAIWHRRSEATGAGTRHLLKYNCWRTAAPRRDWIADPDFNFSDKRVTATGPRRWAVEAMFEQFQLEIAAAQRFSWMCGIEDWRFLGGQCWPVVPTVLEGDEQEGIPPELERHRHAPEQVRTAETVTAG